MSEQDNRSWGINTIMTAISMLGTIACTLAVLFAKMSMENLSLERQKSDLIIMAAVNERFVSKAELMAMTDSLSRLTSMSMENNTAIKLIQNQLSKQQYQRLN